MTIERKACSIRQFAKATWWVANYTDRYAVQNQVSRAIIRALKEAGVVLPYEKGGMNVKIDADQPISERNKHPPLSPRNIDSQQ